MYLVLVLSIFATSNVLPVITTTSPSRRFKLSIQNCTYSENELFHDQIPISSLSACAAHCNSMAPICKSFVRKKGRCEMLHVGKCPVPCDSSADVSTEWELYVPEGKTNVIFGKYSIHVQLCRVKLLGILYVFLLTLTLNRTGKIIPFHCLNRELARLRVCHCSFNLYGFRFSFRYRSCIRITNINNRDFYVHQGFSLKD